jgi:hypothetical protein
MSVICAIDLQAMRRCSSSALLSGVSVTSRPPWTRLKELNVFPAEVVRERLLQKTDRAAFIVRVFRQKVHTLVDQSASLLVQHTNLEKARDKTVPVWQ